jgi:hypothetical protein
LNRKYQKIRLKNRKRCDTLNIEPCRLNIILM